jgi:hypothetical protein
MKLLYLNLSNDVDHPCVNLVRVGQCVDGERLREDGDNSGQVRVFRPEDDGVVALNQIAEVAVYEGGFVNIFGNREP